MRRRKRAEAPAGIPSPMEFFGLLRWLDGRPLLDTIEPYRRRILSEALFTFDASGNPQYNLVLDGRGKKNSKTTDLILACFYRFFIWKSNAGNDVYILANDEKQAGDDLKLAQEVARRQPGAVARGRVDCEGARAGGRPGGAGNPAGEGRGWSAWQNLPCMRL
jgi:hypothetical protein